MNANAPAKKAAAKAPAQKTKAKVPAKKAAKQAASEQEDGAVATVDKREARCVLRSLRVSPRKLNLVAQSIRGLHVEDALAELQFSRKRIAHDVYKCLWSAQANAEENHQLDIDSLIVAQAFVGKNLVMKRMSARARGRGARIEKPFSQLTIIVREVEGAREKRRGHKPDKAAKKTAKRTDQKAQAGAA